jgi:hypothetical protein
MAPGMRPQRQVLIVVQTMGLIYPISFKLKSFQKDNLNIDSAIVRVAED